MLDTTSASSFKTSPTLFGWTRRRNLSTKLTTPEPCSFFISLLVNNATSYETINSHGDSSYLALFNNSDSTCSGTARLFTPVSSSPIHCAYYRSNGYTMQESFVSCNFNWSALETLNLVPSNNGTLPAGTKVRIYGLKK